MIAYSNVEENAEGEAVTTAKRYKPLVDKLFLIIMIPTAALVLGVTVIPALFNAVTLFFALPVCAFVGYFLVSPLFGYVELREKTLFIKFGFILKREIPYAKIRCAQRGRGVISDSIMSLKNSFEHVNIKYNSFDVVTVSVVGNDEFIAELEARI